MYGPRADAINAGVPTDRLVAEWEVDAGPGREPLIDEVGELPRIVNIDADGIPRATAPKGKKLLLEVPESISGMIRNEPARAESWRASVRQGFSDSFARAYCATAFVTIADHEAGSSRCYYVMESR